MRNREVYPDGCFEERPFFGLIEVRSFETTDIFDSSNQRMSPDLEIPVAQAAFSAYVLTEEALVS